MIVSLRKVENKTIDTEISISDRIDKSLNVIRKSRNVNQKFSNEIWNNFDPQQGNVNLDDLRNIKHGNDFRELHRIHHGEMTLQSEHNITIQITNDDFNTHINIRDNCI